MIAILVFHVPFPTLMPKMAPVDAAVVARASDLIVLVDAAPEPYLPTVRRAPFSKAGVAAKAVVLERLAVRSDGVEDRRAFGGMSGQAVLFLKRPSGPGGAWLLADHASRRISLREGRARARSSPVFDDRLRVAGSKWWVDSYLLFPKTLGVRNGRASWQAIAVELARMLPKDRSRRVVSVFRLPLRTGQHVHLEG